MFNPGDILLYDARALKFATIIPKLIRLITGNKITHVAMYLKKDGENHIILDALISGVKLKTLTTSQLYDRSKENFKLYGISRLPEIELLPDVVKKTDMFLWMAEKYAPSPYAIKTICNLLLQHGIGRIYPDKQWKVSFKSSKGYICSEACQLVMEDIIKLNQINITFTKVAAITEPDDYLKAPWKVITL